MHCYLLLPELSQGYILIQLIIILTRKDFPRWKWVIMPPFSSGNGRFPEIKITTGLEHSSPHRISWLSTPSLPPCWPVHVLPHTDIHMHTARKILVPSRPAGDLNYTQCGDLVLACQCNQWFYHWKKSMQVGNFWKLFRGCIKRREYAEHVK